jgi:hypothetical protein
MKKKKNGQLKWIVRYYSVLVKKIDSKIFKIHILIKDITNMVEKKKYILLVGVEGKTCLMYAGDGYSNIYHDIDKAFEDLNKTDETENKWCICKLYKNNESGIYHYEDKEIIY